MQARSSRSSSSTQSSDLINQPGTFLIIPVTELKVDSEYQRPLTGGRVDRIKDNWSWIACGSITVALRGPGSSNYYIIDGQHRVAAAERAGITELPCLVFESISNTDEAQGFLDVNIARKAMSVLDRYRAMLVTNDPIALKVKTLLEQADRIASSAGVSGINHNDPRGVKCLDFIMHSLSVDEECFEKLWPLMIDICDGRQMTKKILQGLFYTERFLTNTSLLDRHWRKRLLQVGYDGISKSIDETCAFEGKGGSAVCANDILRAINRGLRNKLEIQIKAQTPETENE